MYKASLNKLTCFGGINQKLVYPGKNPICSSEPVDLFNIDIRYIIKISFKNIKIKNLKSSKTFKIIYIWYNTCVNADGIPVLSKVFIYEL